MDPNLLMLEFDQIISRLAACARTKGGRERCLKLLPLRDPQLLRRRTAESVSAKRLVESVGHAPLCAMEGLELLLEKLRLGEILSVDECREAGEFLRHCRLLHKYAERAVTVDVLVGSWGLSVDPLAEIFEEIDRCIRGDGVADAASPRLRTIRMEQEKLGGKIKEKLSSLLRGHPDWFQESYHSMRSGHFVLPVKRECRQLLRGSVLDASSSGATVFIEPESVGALQSELDLKRIDEENEVARILAALSASLAARAQTLRQNAEAMVDIDFAFACGRLAADMRASAAVPTAKRQLLLKKARHPLLGSGAVPLDISLGQVRALVITGPNTGGKTVALKTVGLLSLMAMSGLLVPADEAVIPLFDVVLCDIGDGQNIQQSLSTFSSHVTRVKSILEQASGKSLVLLDELGSGTDPQEGMGLAVAVLEELGRRGCLLVATSHYPEIKRFAASAPGFTNARMTFDRTTLTPQYRLEMGEAGESCALYIAQRLGLSRTLLERAWQAAYPEGHAAEERNTVEGGRPVVAVQMPQDVMTEENQKTAEPQESADSGKAEAKEPEIGEVAEDMPIALDEPEKKAAYGAQFHLGDAVFVTSMGRHGIICMERNARGELGVRIQGKNFTVPEKRLKPFVSAEALYPGEGYDMDVVLKSWEERKQIRDVRKGKRGAVHEIDTGKSDT